MAKATDLLKKDHETVEKLFGEYEKVSGSGSKEAQNVAEQIFVELQAHAQVEEELFYPALQDADEKAVSLVAEALEEHKAAEGLMDQLAESSPGSEDYKAKMTTLMSSVRHHVEEEEKEVFPLAEKALGKRLDDIGRQIEDRKKEVRKVA